MNVLSLFDGISCGRQALKDAGITVWNYYSSEIDKAALKVSAKNHPEIVQLGDITKNYEWSLPKIHLVLAGSPCQGFSTAGVGKNFGDPRSGLIFEFFKILEYYKPRFFLLENVVMKKIYSEIISDILGVEPVEINSKNFVPQSRRRLYWTNIPVAPITGQGRRLSSVLLPREFCKDITERMLLKKVGTLAHKKAFECVRTDNQTAMCLTATGQKISNSGATNFFIEGRYWLPHPVECERLQGLPDNYTSGLSDGKRYSLLGNGWTVPVIVHILKGMKNV